MRLHRLLLRLYPKSFGNEYSEELRRVFARRRRDASGPMGVITLWMREIADTVSNAAAAHADILRQDLRHSLRALRRNPGFFAAAVGVTALGIGATTASFTLADHVLLKPLPLREPDRLVKIWESNINRPPTARGLQMTNDVAPANYRDWKAQSTSFSEMGAYSISASNLVGLGEPERLAGASVTYDAMATLGVQPIAGRSLTAADDQPGAPCVTLIGEGLWRSKFGGQSLAGRQIRLDDEQCDVVGVMPGTFQFPARDSSFWRPIRFPVDIFEDRGNSYLRVIARLKPGVSIDQASADLKRVSMRLIEMYPVDNRDVGAAVIWLRDEMSPQARTLIYALAGASACLLLIACTNLASLFLARATSRAQEFAVRSALGAGSERLVRQLLTDTLIIALAGAAAGVGIAFLAVPLVVKLVPTALPIAEVPAADLRMLVIAAIGTFITVLACGVLPSVRASRRATAGALRDGARAGSSRGTERARAYLVVAQVAASVALLVCAGLLLRALWRVQGVDTGFRTDGVLTMRLNLTFPRYAPNEARVQFYRRVVENVGQLPGVDAVGFTTSLPLVARGMVWGIYLPGKSLDPGLEEHISSSRFVTPEYFKAMRIPLKEGRTFDDRDSLKSEQTAIVSEAFGRLLWPGESMIGKRFVVMQTERTIVGVVGEIRVRGLERPSESQMYLPYLQQPDSRWVGYTPRDLVVRASSGLDADKAGGLMRSIRTIVAQADPQLPISDVRPLASIVEGETTARAVQAAVLRAFAAVACVLAAVGLHGLLAFMVSARTREIGVRIALGARRRDILGMVLGRGLRLAGIGGALGLAVGYFAGRSFQTVLAGVDPADVLTLAIAAGLAVAMTLGGSLLPARRAANTNPMTATRAE